MRSSSKSKPTVLQQNAAGRFFIGAKRLPPRGEGKERITPLRKNF